MNENFLLAFGLTLIAGLSTGIGSAFAFFPKKNNTRFLSASLGFSAGVMIYVSMIEIFFKAQKSLTLILGEKNGTIITVISFFTGMFIIAIIDKFIPCGNPQDLIIDHNNEGGNDNAKLMRTGVFTALAIAIHNFPEGLATFVSAMEDPVMAIPIVFAIAIHNIPEGISVAVPIYYATGNKKKAFLLSFASGLTEPIGAVIGYLILMPFMNEVVYGVLFAGVAGIMVFISLDELLPASREYGEHHLSIYGLVCGMIVMAVSLIIFI